MITKPDSTTKEIAAEPRIEEGLLIVGVYMILLLIGSYVSMTHLQYIGSVGGVDASMLKTISLVTAIIEAIIVALIGWPILTGIVHVLSMFFGGDGKFYPGMMTLIGYCAIPLIIVTILSIIVSLFMPTVTVDLTSPASTQSATSSMLGSPLGIVSAIITVLGSLWTAYMMAHAVKNGEKLSANNAYIIVGILFVVNLIITFGSLILTLVKF